MKFPVRLKEEAQLRSNLKEVLLGTPALSYLIFYRIVKTPSQYRPSHDPADRVPRHS